MATFRERFAEKATSVRALVLLLLILVLCRNAWVDPSGWRDMFNAALGMALGFYFRDAEKTTGHSSGTPQ